VFDDEVRFVNKPLRIQICISLGAAAYRSSRRSATAEKKMCVC
jgi:hypothetical protein